MPVKGKDSGTELQIAPLQHGSLTVCLRGVSPLVYNSMSFKAKRTLLAPERAGRMSTAEKAANVKHVPISEYRDSVYAFSDTEVEHDKRFTRLYFPSTGFKASCAQAAIDTPGARKAAIGRLLRVEGRSVEIYGIPTLYMAQVRSADMQHTPDIRTRASLPQWACRVTLSFVIPNLKHQTVGVLISNAGQICGIGDNRQEKGSGDCGRWVIVDEDDSEFKEIMSMGIEAQDAALKSPAMFDVETEELYSWYVEEMERRAGLKATVRPVTNGKQTTAVRAEAEE